MKRRFLVSLASASLAGAAMFTIAQPPPPRMHKVTTKGELKLLPATTRPSTESEVTIEVVGDDRIIRSNGIPNHKTGQFPNRGNPNVISTQSHEYRVPANPIIADRVTPMHGEFGVAINGVPFDPGAGEFYDGEPGWQYEPLSGAIALGIDVSHAHVQPTGKYHYHGLPTGLIDSVKVEKGSHSPLIGWAADGFPIYAVYGFGDPNDPKSSVQKLTSSYRLKKGDRPGGDAPDGPYDGTFVRDYEYVAGSGDLDECNGRQCVTPEFPEGTYAYFMTEEWPVVPRNYRGTPSDDFRHGPGPGGPGSRPDRRGLADDRGRGGPEQRGLEQRGRGPGGRGPGGRGQGGGRPRPGEVLPQFVAQSLNLDAKQQKRLDALQKLVDKRLAEILTPQQQQQLQRGGPHEDRPGGGPPQFERGDRAGGRPR